MYFFIFIVCLLCATLLMMIFFARSKLQTTQHKVEPYNVGKIVATIIFKDDSFKKFIFEGKVLRSSWATVHGVYPYNVPKTAESIFFQWLEDNKKTGFVYVDENHLVKVSDIKEILLCKEEHIITV